MNREAKTQLKEKVEKYYPEIGPLEIEDFFRLIGKDLLPYIIYDNEIWFPSVPISELLGRDRRDFPANWVGKSERNRLTGKCIQFKDKAIDIRKDFKRRYPTYKLIISGNTWFLNWRQAYDYISNSTFSVKKDLELNGDRVRVIYENGTLYISSWEIAERLCIKHKSLFRLIKKYEEVIESFGPALLKIEKDVTRIRSNKSRMVSRHFYMLNEDQAYLIGALARNSDRAIDFKCWIVKQFARARFLKGMNDKADNTEEVIHTQLTQLSLYTSLSMQTEFPLEIEVPKRKGYVTKVKRIDILLNKQVAIELKSNKITVTQVTEIVASRGYYHKLNQLPNFKYLIISSPLGLSEEAARLVETMQPKLIFKYPHEIGDRLAKLALKEYPKQSHWWLKKFVFPKFSRVLSKDFFDSLEED